MIDHACVCRFRAMIRDSRGTVAIVAAIMLPIMMTAGAFAVDLGNFYLIRNQLQTAADSAALAAVQYIDTQATAQTKAVEYALKNVPTSFGNVTQISDITFGTYNSATGAFTATTLNPTAVQVVAQRTAARGNAASRLLSVLVSNDAVGISVIAIAARTMTIKYEAQVLKNYSASSATYNEVAAYCYKYSGSGSAASRRTQMTVIAHNVKPDYPSTTIPKCEAGESLSFRMRSVDGGIFHPERMNNPSWSTSFYTDTVISGSTQTFSSSVGKKLEMIRCDTVAQCKLKTEGGTVPVGAYRNPTQDSRACEPGKFMFFGGEDWTDYDYDDIRFSIACPSKEVQIANSSRLVR